MSVQSRYHVELVHAATVAEQPFRPSGSPAGRTVRLLSSGDEQEAGTMLVRYPAGWQTNGPVRFADQTELYVRRGELWIGDARMTPDSYAFIPPGAAAGFRAGAEGAEVLTFHEGPAAMDEVSAPVEAPAAGIRIVHTADVDWAPSASPGLPGGLVFKRLHFDPTTQQRTTLLAGPPGWDSRLHEFHPCAEEAFCLAGDIEMDHLEPPDLMQQDDYFWRPAFLSHGPMRTRTGFLLVVRTDRRHVNHLSTTRIDPVTARRIDVEHPEGLRP